jgi:PAS domain S-box-containing protein
MTMVIRPPDDGPQDDDEAVCAGSALRVYWRRAHHGQGVRQSLIKRRSTRRLASPPGELAQAQLAAILESSDDAIIAKTLEGVITSWNPGAERIFGFTAAEAVGQSITMLIPADRLAEEDEVLARLRRGEKVDHFETVRQAKDGRLLDVLLTVSPIKDPTGKVIGASKVARDITERKRADVLQGRLAAIVESSDDAIVAKTLDGIITSWNRGAEEVFGFTAAEAVGRSITMLIPEDRLAEEDHVLARLRRGEKIDHFETVRQRKDGRLIDVSLTVSPIRDATGKVIGASKVARDITDHKQADAERQKWLEREQVARRRAERAVQMRDEFLATVSHELRSPLNAIVGWAHLLRAGGMDPDHVQRAVETITRNAMMQDQLISDILDVQRLTSGKVRLDIREVDLALVVEAALDTVRPAAQAKGITLAPLLTSASHSVMGDPDRMQQVIWNLLSNAVKFTPEGGNVRVSLADDDTHVEITVEDSGPGVRPDFLPYVFERFRQDFASTRKQGGLGLGLAIVRHLVELHGGAVAARNGDQGTGAVFTVRLPRTSAAHVDAVLRPEASEDGDDAFEGAPSLRDVRVLIVDDEPDAREVVAAVLSRCGADVTVAGSAEEALGLLGRVRPHVLVSDISMPDQDGYALLRSIRALPASEGGLTPAVALTATVTTEDRLRALRAGYQFHMPKPVQPAQLAEAIASLAAGKSV